jgi:hypothetical protein
MSMRAILCATLAALTVAGCTYYQPATVVYRPPDFDRSWDAALGAAHDLGVAVSTADRTSGYIYGTTADTDVTIRAFTQADGKVRVEFNASGAPGFADRLSEAYQRRMGR